MGFKVMVHDVVFLYREIELPERCPGFFDDKNDKCNADLTQPDALKVVEYQDQTRGAYLKHNEGHSDDIEWDNSAGLQQGDDHVEVAYFCARCDHELEVGRALLKEGDADLWSKIEKLVKG